MLDRLLILILPIKLILVIVAPATANMIGKMANGIADDMITTTILATKAPVWVATAMNVNMYEHPAVKTILRILEDFGYRIFEPGEGVLACGWVGKGRMPNQKICLQQLKAFFKSSGRKILLEKNYCDSWSNSRKN